MQKFIIILFLCICILIGCQNQEIDKEQSSSEEPDDIEETMPEEDPTLMSLPIEITENEARFSLADLISITDGSYQFDPVHRTLSLKINEDEFYLIDGVPVLERNGEYIASNDIYLIVEGEQGEEEIYLPVQFIEDGLTIPIEFEENQIVFNWYGPTEKVGGPPLDFQYSDWTTTQVIDYLSFLEKPIEDAGISHIASHLPGAPRPYRNGFHEGIDWYDFASGGDITTETPIYAMGEGIVVRADHDYVEYPSPEVRNKDLEYTAELGETPEFIFDRLRGRQVWVQYPGGIMNRFAHLSGIPETLQVGDAVDAKTIIGYVGNSGTSFAVDGQLSGGLHLHQDLLIYGELFWKPFSQEEVSEILQEIWN
ncbi:M23 family metallopeptidase [Bacillus suaedae]|nr:M23 family metallopeptidase [Bacillus suaedae]